MKPTLTRCLVALVLAGAPFLAFADEADMPPAGEADTRGETPREEASVVDEAVQDTTDAATAAQREKLVDDAVRALDETQAALQALEDGDTDAALEALAIATGKLDLVVARRPELALAPIDVRLVTHDVYGSVDAVEAATERAADLLEDGRVQHAREVVENLRSDVVLEVWNVPLATYPDAIRAIAPLIDAGELEQARHALQQALDTLVLTQHVHPLPILRAQHMLGRAEELAETADRTEEQNEELSSLLDAVRRELRLAEVLGYGDPEDFETYREQLDEIARRTGGGKSGEGFFDRIKQSLRAFGDAPGEAAAG